ncbi:MAG TPA: hypothetical protein VE093_12475 [Polyangiaceae bacterium]|jgi:hypothetical protein|nr:hypothetical protein [Polyangiaceae bacterium]
MGRWKLVRLVVALAAFWLGGLASGCGSGSELKLCGQIPADGCPIGRGGTCEDATCAALYDCIEGAWTPVETCSGFGGAGGGGGAGGIGGVGGAGGCTPVMFDRSEETTGCEPDLQNPDCPAVAAETCAEMACFTDCLEFFLCTKDGWRDVAYCDPDGVLVVLP